MAAITKKYSFWWENSPPDFAFQPQLNPSADIIIIGAGFAGISTAYWLLRLTKNSKKRMRITILDKAPYAAFKASGRMNGSVYLGSNKTPKAVVDKLGKEKAERLYNYSSQNNSLLRNVLVDRKLDCDAEFNGGIRMASTAKDVVELDVSAELLTEWGFTPAKFDHDQSQHIMIAPQAQASLYIPDEGMFDPFAYCNKLAQYMRKVNIQVVYGVNVLGVESTPNGSPIVHLDNGHTITANNVIHATSETVPSQLIQDSIVQRREHVVYTEKLSEELDSDLPLPLMPIELNKGSDSVRLYQRSIIMTGGKAGLRKDPELNVTDDNWYNRRILDHLDKTMLTHFPVTNHLDVEHSWTYIETSTVDELPFMGQIPGYPNQFVNIAHGRNKFGLAMLGGKNVAEATLGLKVRDEDFEIFDPKRLIEGE